MLNHGIELNSIPSLALLTCFFFALVSSFNRLELVTLSHNFNSSAFNLAANTETKNFHKKCDVLRLLLHLVQNPKVEGNNLKHQLNENEKQIQFVQFEIFSVCVELSNHHIYYIYYTI